MTHNQVYNHMIFPLMGKGSTGLKWFRLHKGDPGEVGTDNLISSSSGINKRLPSSTISGPFTFGAEVTVYESATVTHCSLWNQFSGMRFTAFTCKYDPPKVIAQDEMASLEILLDINIQITA